MLGIVVGIVAFGLILIWPRFWPSKRYNFERKVFFIHSFFFFFHYTLINNIQLIVNLISMFLLLEQAKV